MTADEWAAEDYRKQRRSRGWCPVIVVGLLVLAVTSFRVAALVLDRMCR